MLLPNLYGNIVSNVGAGLVGGAGVVSGMNVGWDYVVFEQGARHTFTSMAAQNVANPTGMLLSATDMLKQLGYEMGMWVCIYILCLCVCVCVCVYVLWMYACVCLWWVGVCVWVWIVELCVLCAVECTPMLK